MKIIKRPKLIPVGCKRCGCVFQPKMRNLRIDEETFVRDEVICPICKTTNKANFQVERNVGNDIARLDKDNEL